MKKYLNFTGLLIIILFSFIQFSCNSDDIELGDIEQVKLEKISSDHISMNIAVPVVNPNKFNITLTKYNLLIKLNNQEFQLADSKKNIKIPKKFSGTVQIPIKLKSNTVLSFSTIANLYQLFSSKKADIEVEGSIKVRVFLIPKKIKVKEKRTINF